MPPRTLIFSSPRAEHAPDDGRDGAFGRLLAQPLRRHELAEQLLGRERAVADQREQILGRLGADVGQRLGERLGLLRWP